MKRKLLFAMLCIVSALGMRAQTWTAPTIQGEDPVAGTQYKVMNVGAGTFLDMGKAWFSWNTTAILSNTGINFTMTADGSNWKFIRTGTQGVFTSGNGIAGDAMHVDNTAHTYGITKLPNGYYHIHDAGGNASSLCWGNDGTSVGVVAHADATASGWMCEWVFILPANVEAVANLYSARLALYNEYLMAYAEGANTDAAAEVYNNASATVAQLNEAKAALHQVRIDYRVSLATETNPQDLTEFFVVNADFSTKDGTGWTRTGSAGNQQYGTGAMESWNNNNVSVTQNLTGLPNGRYRVTCDMISGNTGRTAYVYAKGMTEVNGENVSAQASAGNYTTMSNEVAGNTVNAYPVIVGDHTMTIGFKDPSGWVVVDNFKVIYYGPDLTAFKDALQALIDGVPALAGTTTTAAYNAAKSYADGIDMDALTTEEAITNAATELSSRINTAKSLQANYTRYTSVKTAAQTISTNVATANADSEVAAATTTDAIDAAIATLRAAFLAELPNVTVPTDPGYIDVTSVMVDNAGVRTNTDFWTIEGTPNGGYSFGVCNYNECEFYNCNFKFYQTLALTPGTWEFGVTGFHRAGNHSTYFYAGDDKILIPGVESSVVNTMAQAQTYFDNGNGKVALKFLMETAQTIEIGIDNQDTQTDKWTIFRDFTLKYYGAPDYSVYDQQWADAVTAANEALDAQAYKYVSGSERTAVTDAIADAPDGSSKANYLEKIQALEAATATFKAAASSYNAWVLAKTATKDLWGSALGVADPTTAAEAAAGVNALKVAQYNKVATDYTFSLTGKIGEFSTWTKSATSNGVEDTPQTLSTEHYRGKGYTYYEQGKNGWAANSFTVDYMKTANLPAGNYVIKVATRASGNVTGTVAASATTKTVAIANVGASSKGITTSGVASFDEGEFANGGVGYGWEWRFLPFTVAADGDVSISIHAESSSQHGWVSIADAELLSDADKSTSVTYNEAVANTIEDVDVANVTMSRAIKEGYNTVVLPFSLTSAQVATAFGTGTEVYYFSEASDDSNDVTINFTSGDGSITANVPVLVKATAASSAQNFNGVEVNEPMYVEGPLVEGKIVRFVGTYAPITVAAGDYFVSGGLLYKSAGATNLKAFRAYIDAQEASSVKMFIDGLETAISAINAETEVEQGAIYNLAGQRVSKTVRGIYVKNGKKVVVK